MADNRAKSPDGLTIPLSGIHCFQPLRPFNWFLTKKLRLVEPEAVFVSWLIFLLVYAGGIWGFRRIMDTPYPENFTGLFYVAPGSAFYYPDWNAITFDGVLNPVLLTLASVFSPLVAKRLIMLYRSNLLQLKDSSRVHPLKLPAWSIFAFPLLLAIITIVGCWFSRYRLYVSDPLAFRFYVLFLIGLSTYVRWSLLILAIQTVLLIRKSNFKPTKRFFIRGGEVDIYPLGDLAILLTLAFYGLAAYAVATIGTSVVKEVRIEIDAMFWEAILHLSASLVGFGFVLVKLGYQPYWALQELRDDLMKNQARFNDVKDTHQRYKAGLSQLLNQMGQDHPRYSDVLTYQQRLIDNIDHARLYGDTETSKAERAKIIHRLNELTLSELHTSFNELCGLSTPDIGQESDEHLQRVSMLPIWRSAQRQAILLIPFLLLTLIPLFLWIGGLISRR